MPTPMMEQYHRIKRDYPEDVIFFRMGDFFEMFHDDAVTAHKILGITLTRRAHGKGKSAEVPLAGFPHHQLENYLARMTRAGKRVVVVEQMEDPKQAKGLVKRDIVRVVTAGTNLSEEALEHDRNQFLAALVRTESGIGLGLCDVTTGEFTTGVVPPDLLRDRLALLNPNEVICDEEQREELRPMLAGQPMFTPLPPWIFELEFARDTLLGHFGVASLKGFGIAKEEPAIRAAGAALHYIRENLRTDPTHIRGLGRLPLENHLALDESTRRNLELVEPLRGSDTSTTLFQHLDRTVTPFGRRHFRNQLLRPLQQSEQIEERLDAVEWLHQQRTLREKLRERLRALGDLERLTARLATGRGSPRDAGALRDTLHAIPEFTAQMADLSDALLARLRDRMDPLEALAAELREGLVEDPPATLMNGGAIRQGYNPRLDEVRTIARGGKDYILARQEEERQATGIASLAIGYNKVFGYYIEVSKANLAKVPDHYIRKQTLVNAERFITPDLKEWEEKILRAEEEALELERSLFEELRGHVSSNAEALQANAQVLAELDSLAAAAELARDRKYNRPRLHGGDRLRIVQGRHPVIENLLPPGESFVTNDLELGTPKRQVGLVTGPNMGGKSTYLRQVGLIVLMAHVGLFVPAREAEIPLTDRIFTRVGASDNLAGGESTFLVEMHEAANILHNATERSLILLDEIGRGTSTFDGLSLAWAMVEYLHDYPGDQQPKTLFATHYHELTELENVLARVFNLHVQVKEWGERIVFLRKVLEGRSGASYGIQVARLAGVPPAVIERAREVLETLEASELVNGNVPRLAKGARATAEQKQDPLQISLFTVEERAVRDALAKADLDNMTPMEALRMLADLREKYGNPAPESAPGEENE